jgi:predicted transcriptional regulator
MSIGRELQHNTTPVIYLIYCGADKKTKDDITRHIARNMDLMGSQIQFDYRDYEHDRSGNELNSQFKDWVNTAWYVLVLASNNWRDISAEMRSELHYVQHRAKEIESKHGKKHQFVSILSIENLVDTDAEAVIKSFGIQWLPYYPTQAGNDSIVALIEKFSAMPAWTHSKNAAQVAQVPVAQTTKLGEFFSQKVESIVTGPPRTAPEDITVGKTLTLFDKSLKANQLFLIENSGKSEGKVIALLTKGRVQDYLPPKTAMINAVLDKITEKQRIDIENLKKIDEQRRASKAIDIAFRLGEFPVLHPDEDLGLALDGFLMSEGQRQRRVRALAVMSGRTAHGIIGYWDIISRLLTNNLIPDEPVEAHMTPNEEMYIATVTDSLETLSMEMLSKDVAQLPVVSDMKDKIYSGTIRREIVRNLIDEDFARLADLPVVMFLENFRATIERGSSLRDVAEYFRTDTGYPMLSILEPDGKTLVGTITYVDILRVVKNTL